jgi:predicted LPLAT superfamily acyltransferase
MNTQFYNTLIRLTRWGGPWVFRLFGGVIATGYFLFFPKRVAGSVRFYQALFPHRRVGFALWCTFCQYHQFTTVFFDRYRHLDLNEITYTSTGWDHIQKAAANGTGGIILMSHLGNWEMAAHFLQKKIEGVKILLYMGRKHREQVEKLQKDALKDTGITIIAVDRTKPSPFTIVDGVNRLKAGEFVSLTGDRVWHPDQRTVTVDFLDHHIQLPVAPYILALMANKPVYVFFSLRTGPQSYHISCAPPIEVTPRDRAHRQEAITQSAQVYANLLADMARRHPYQWYHFTDFIKDT